MELYRGTISSKKPDGSFVHLGSLMAACNRLETLFISRNIHAYDGEKFILYSNNGDRIGTKHPNAVFDEFIDFAKNAFIQAYNPTLKKPLRLNDCWEDDPIASGGMNIFSDFESFSAKEKKELNALFHPFGSHILYPEVIDIFLNQDDIKSTLQRNKNNKFFQTEYTKRRERAETRGELWHIVEPYEIVWIDLTLRFRTWALINGYSHFEYTNKSEDKGHTSYVVLHPASIGTPLKTLGFDTQKLKDLAAPKYETFLRSGWERATGGASNKIGRQVDTLWCGFNPTEFVI